MTEKEINLNKWQDTFFESGVKHVALFNEFGSGKTTIAVAKFKKILDDNPGITGVVLRNINDELKTSTIPIFFELIFGDRFSPTSDVYYNKVDKHLIFQNKSDLWFMALDNIKAMKKLKNIVIGVLFGDQGEELDKEVWNMGISRLRQPNMPNCSMLVGNPEGGDHWVKDMYYSTQIDIENGEIYNEKCQWGYWKGIDSDFLGIMAKPRANECNLPKNYYDDLIKINSHSWVLKYVYSQWIGKAGLIYPFDDNNIVYEADYFDVTNLSQDFDTLFEMQDYGISEDNPMVFLWGIRRLDGTIYIVNEYYEYTKGIKHCADYVSQTRPIFNIDTKFTVGCPRTFQKEGTSDRKPADLFRQHGINIIQFAIHFDVRQPLIEKLIETKNIKIFERCTNLIKELRTRKWKNIKTAQDHATEALERGVTKLITTNTKKIDEYNKPVDSKKRRLQPLTAGIMDRQF